MFFKMSSLRQEHRSGHIFLPDLTGVYNIRGASLVDVVFAASTANSIANQRLKNLTNVLPLVGHKYGSFL